MFVETQTHQQREIFHVPLVLHEGTGYAHILSHIAFIPGHHIVKPIFLILYTAGKHSRSKKAITNAPSICSTRNPSKVIGSSIGIGIPQCAIVTATIDMLQRCEKREFVIIPLPTMVVGNATAVYDMTRLLGNVTLMRFKVEFVSTTTELVRRMILHAQAACMSRTIIGTQTESVEIHLSQFRETVTVVVVRIAVAIVGISRYSIGVVL